MRFSYVAEHYLTLGMIGFLYPVIISLNKTFVGKILTYFFIGFIAFQSFDYLSNYKTEKQILETNITKNPNSILPHNILGLLYKNENNYEKAFYHFDRSNQIHPNAASYYNKASLYDKINQLDLAKINYEKAIDLNPFVGNSYNSLAIVCLKLKNPEMALANFEKALQVDPSDVRIYYNIGRVYEDGSNFTLAIEWYTKALTIQPENTLFKEAIKRVSR